MTGMPELIAMLHSFVGLAAVLVGLEQLLREDACYPGIHDVEVFVGVFIGAVTFTGSIVAFLKLSARIKSAPLMLPGHNGINLGAIVAFFVLTVVYVLSPRGHLACARPCSGWSPLHRAASWAGTWSPRSAAATCPSSCRCSTATRAGRRPRPGSCSATTCSSSPAPSWAPPVPTCPTSCAGR